MDKTHSAKMVRDKSRGSLVNSQGETEYARKKKEGNPVWINLDEYKLMQLGARREDVTQNVWLNAAVREKAERDGITTRKSRGWKRYGKSGT